MRIEIRGNQVLLDGYVNAVERESRVLPSPRGRFKEKIRPKTFEKALRKADDVELRFNHDPNMRLGSIKEGNLQLFEDNIGLRAITTVTDENVVQKAKNGELRGWSFGFIDNNPTWEDGPEGIALRYLDDIDLIEVSILDKTPAYIATSIEARGEEQVISEQRGDEFRAEIEDLTKVEEKREESLVDYSVFEKEIEFLKMKGGNH
ncbi:HK97 family phage prohead protease [Robertmurraya korlensis]|uniref:HK97 family phage prohead protease n=1 Tax=Robertmurraya korlensis TaxID=519977 RepID=UPI00203E9D4E|nr:HK97 family phage prohead protease [Robertmurraya korlensis]MCM3599385.1 HK97 family phage prohead protease [Robertmurraya korlensis]